MLSLLLACGPDVGAPVRTSLDPTATDTGAHVDEPPPRPIRADCALDGDNALRVHCAVALDGGGPAAVVVSGPGFAPRTYASDADSLEHDILLWGLPPEATIAWRAGDFGGELTTGPLPAAIASADIRVDGALDGADAVFFACKTETMFFAMVDGAGRVVWYEPAALHIGPMTGYTWSQADRSLVEIGGGALSERDVGGNVLLALRQGEHFQSALHHDVARWGPRTYLLGQRDEVDTVEVFEGEVPLGTFALDAWFDLPYSAHANGITVSEDGRIALSLRNYDAVLAIDGDPVSPGFLDLLWLASGVPTSDLGTPDLAPVDGRLFRAQHHATIRGDELWVFDNSSDPAGSRALRMLADAEAGTLAEDASWSVGGSCAIQGGAVPLEGGGVLATCSDGSLVERFHEGESAPAWTMRTACQGWSMTRALPVRIP